MQQHKLYLLLLVDALLVKLLACAMESRKHYRSLVSEIAATINEFSGSSLGYGYSWIMSKPRSQPSDSSDDNQITEGTLVPSPKDKD
ncbi:hypothetical protein CsSME_00012771 [Camellia sinensis var. sinensis]